MFYTSMVQGNAQWRQKQGTDHGTEYLTLIDDDHSKGDTDGLLHWGV